MGEKQQIIIGSEDSGYYAELYIDMDGLDGPVTESDLDDLGKDSDLFEALIEQHSAIPVKEIINGDEPGSTLVTDWHENGTKWLEEDCYTDENGDDFATVRTWNEDGSFRGETNLKNGIEIKSGQSDSGGLQPPSI